MLQLSLFTAALPAGPAPVPPAVSVYFSPKGGAAAAVVREIAAARKEVLVQAYAFTSAEIAAALVEARRRGVTVAVCVDELESQSPLFVGPKLVAGGVGVWVDTKERIAHSKVVVIDARVVITGSLNFTYSADRDNLENLLVLRSTDLAAKFVANWRLHRAHSQAWQPKTQDPRPKTQEPAR